MNLDAYHASRDIDHQPFRSACYAPFVGLSFDFHGTVSVCSFTRTRPVGRVGEDRLVDMWRGPKITRLREALRADDLDSACARCAEEIAGGNLHGVLANGFDRFQASAAPEWPSRMEFALSNACNLQCIMCNGTFSSAIRAHREGLPPPPSRYGDSFFEELTPFLEHLDQARFLGGEPFLAKENFRIWDLMIETGSKAECNVTTNGTQWFPRTEQALEALPFSIGISMDGVTRETVEHVRAGASYDVIMRNFQRFLEYRERTGTSLSLTFCLMRDSWHEFGDYLRFAEDHGCQVYVNTVRQPPSRSLYRLPSGELQAVVDCLEGTRSHVDTSLKLNRAVWNEQIDRLCSHLIAHNAGKVRLSLKSGEVEPIDQISKLQLLLDGICDVEEHEILSLIENGYSQSTVTTLRFDNEEQLVEGDSYLGIPLAALKISDASQLLGVLVELFGDLLEVLAEQTSKGTVARAIAIGNAAGVKDDEDPVILVSVWRRNPHSGGLTHIAAIRSHKPHLRTSHKALSEMRNEGHNARC